MISETKQLNDCLWSEEVDLPELAPPGAPGWTRLTKEARQEFNEHLACLRQEGALSGAMDEELLGKYAWSLYLLRRNGETALCLLPSSGAAWADDDAVTLLRRQARFQSRYERKAERLRRWLLQSQSAATPKLTRRKRTPLQSSWKTFRRCSRNLRAAQMAFPQRKTSHQSRAEFTNSTTNSNKELSWKITTSTS